MVDPSTRCLEKRYITGGTIELLVMSVITSISIRLTKEVKLTD